MATLCPHDKSSFANTSEAIVKHMHMVLQVDFDQKKVKGSVAYTLQQEASRLVLDSRNLSIHRVVDSKGNDLPFEVLKADGFPEVFGTPLQISNMATPVVTVHYETTPNSEAIQFLSKEQTVGKDYPFLFTQFCHVSVFSKTFFNILLDVKQYMLVVYYLVKILHQ